APEHPHDQMSEPFIGPREWFASTGDMGQFSIRVLLDVWSGRVLHFFGESVRQAGILILSSALVLWIQSFIIGLGACGIEGAYFGKAQGVPAVAGIFSAWCDLREAIPY